MGYSSKCSNNWFLSDDETAYRCTQIALGFQSGSGKALGVSNEKADGDVYGLHKF